MTHDDEYDLKPREPRRPAPRPGEPGWVEPVPIIEPRDPEPAESPPEETPADPDIALNKAFAILAYIFFVIPLVAAPQSKFARFHANQGLLVFILWFVAIMAVVVLQLLRILATALLTAVPVLGAFFSCLLYLIQPLLLVGALAMMIVGIVHAANGEEKKLPLVGQWTLIK